MQCAYCIVGVRLLIPTVTWSLVLVPLSVLWVQQMTSRSEGLEPWTRQADREEEGMLDGKGRRRTSARRNVCRERRRKFARLVYVRGT